MKKRIVIIALAAIAMALIVLVSAFTGKRPIEAGLTPPADMVNTRAFKDAPTIAGKEPLATPSDAKPKTIAIPGYTQLTMREGNTSQNIGFHNPSENPCYFAVSIIMPDNTTVYRSGLIEPGQKTDEIQLEQVLEAGIYENTTLRYSCYSLKDKALINGADTKFTLEVTQ